MIWKWILKAVTTCEQTACMRRLILSITVQICTKVKTLFFMNHFNFIQVTSSLVQVTLEIQACMFISLFHFYEMLLQKHTYINLCHSWANSADDKLMIFFLLFPSKQILAGYANCLQWRQFAWNVKICFLGKITIFFFSKCPLPKILPSMLSVK